MIRILVFLSLLPAAAFAQKNPIFERIEKSDIHAGFQMEDYWVWCGSVIKAEDGKYHMFASRWPKKLPFHPGWMVASEVVRAVSDTPGGPFIFQEVVLPARGPQYWDGRATHNPSVTRHGDTYVLYYMGSTHPFADPDSTLKLSSAEATVTRANKRIGIATSRSVYGPWERRNEPILNTEPDTFYSFLTSNPAPLIRKDGSALVVFKGRAYGKNFPYQTRQYIGIAKADHFLGEYHVLNDKKTILNPKETGEVEDPFLWEDKEGLHLLVKDMSSKIAGEHHAGVLLHSNDGIKWKTDPAPKAYSRTIHWTDGSQTRQGQLERPFLLIENGVPTHIYFATMDGKGGFENGTRSWNMVVPLRK